MHNLKEHVDELVALGEMVIIEQLQPKKSSLHIIHKEKEQWDGFEMRICRIVSVGPLVPGGVNPGDHFLADRLAGVVIPTMEKGFIKTIHHSLLVAKMNKVEQIKIEDLEPYNNRLLVKVISLVDKTDGGIIIPDIKHTDLFELESLGVEIIAVSSDLTAQFEPGEKLRIEAHSTIPLNSVSKFDADFRIVDSHSVLAKIKNKG